MTNDEIKAQIGQAAIERKECLDQMSCYKRRLDDAAHKLRQLLNDRGNPLHEDNQRFLHLETDPRLDAQGFVEAKTRAEELTAFLKQHNAL
ncbi:MAG: hypothetical protein OXK73_02800 [Rhodospirillaceae bacterium]|nr:hypothetical protein [Rhodospirillaceae bacterium]MDE0360232.1 hypothetical protein [Rhodospirillaceae bacterium]